MKHIVKNDVNWKSSHKNHSTQNNKYFQKIENHHRFCVSKGDNGLQLYQGNVFYILEEYNHGATTLYFVGVGVKFVGFIAHITFQ